MAYILLYSAASGSVSNLRDGNDFERRLARARGRSSVVDIIEEGNGEITEQLMSGQGQIATESGYFQEFVGEDEIDLPIIDVAKKPGRMSYPVPTEAVDSLPHHVLTQVEEQEFARIEGEYDPDEKEFTNVSIGWSADERSAWDQLMREIDEQDAIAPVLDYLVFNHGSERWTPEAIADIRDVRASTVRENIREIRAANEETDPER
jgi:hypothetical protein